MGEATTGRRVELVNAGSLTGNSEVLEYKEKNIPTSSLPSLVVPMALNVSEGNAIAASTSGGRMKSLACASSDMIPE
jgi:hypothetical protein